MTQSTATFSAFAPAQEDAKLLPRLNCLGYIGSVGEAKISQSGVFVVQPITIEGVQGGKKGFVNFLYRPEFLRPGFNPTSLKAEENGMSLWYVYKMHIAGTNSLSTLAGIAGTEENFNQLAAKIQSAIEGIEDVDVPPVVQGILQEFATEVNPEIGFFSSQKMEATGNKTDKGTKEKRPVAGQREVSGYFYPGPDSDKRNLADANKGRSVMAYEA